MFDPKTNFLGNLLSAIISINAHGPNAYGPIPKYVTMEYHKCILLKDAR